MAAKANTPEGYAVVMPYLHLDGAAEAIEFYKKAFGARKRMLLKMAGRIGHAEIEIGDCVVMLADEFPEMGAIGPKALKGTPITLCLHVADVDKTVAKAVALGAKVKSPPADQFYGFRSATIVDPFGHMWMLQKEIEKVTPREMQKRLDAMMATAPATAKRNAKTGKGK